MEKVTKYVGLTLVALAITSFTIMMIVSTLAVMDRMINREDNSQVILYQKYYMATETLLDSLGVDCDDPIFESDAGAEYLKCKYDVDTINN